MIESCRISSCSNAARKRTDACACTPTAAFWCRATLPFTALHELEVRNALRLGVFRQVITDEQAKAAAAAIDADLRIGRLVRTAIKWPAAFRATLRLSEQHAAKTGTRSLDILHIASARALRMKELATFDSRQRALAAAAGLRQAV